MSSTKQSHWLSLAKAFNVGFYQEIVKQPFSRTFVYILLVSLCISVILSAKIAVSLNHFIPMAEEWVLNELPYQWPDELKEIKIVDGEVKVDVKQPYRHTWESFVFVLDTTGEVSNLDEYSSGVLLTKSKLVVKNKKSSAESEIKEYDLSRIKHFSLRKGDISKGIIANIENEKGLLSLSVNILKKWAKNISVIIFFVLIAWFIFNYCVIKLIQALFFSLIGMIINNISKAGLKFSQIFNISSYALTVPTLVALLVIVTGLKLFAFWFFYASIYIIYLALAITNNKQAAAEAAV